MTVRLPRVRRRRPPRDRPCPTATTARLRCPRGQSTVELVALLPLVLLLGLGLLALLSARSAAGEAGAAAQAGAMALIQHDGALPAPPTAAGAAAREALPAAVRRRAQIRVRGRRVTVTVRPRAMPAFMGGLLSSTASADAGPEPPRWP
jgi:hypothetical protein